MTWATVARIPLANDFAGLDSFDQARRITRVARQRGTLTPGLARLRREALCDARQAGHLVAAIASRVGLSAARVSQLTAGEPAGPGTPNPGPAHECAPPPMPLVPRQGHKTTDAANVQASAVEVAL